MADLITNVARVVIRGELHAQETNNVLHFGSVGAVPPDIQSSLSALVNNLRVAIRAAFLQSVSSEWKLIQIKAVQIAPALTNEVTLGGEATDVGALTESLPSFNAGLYHLRTNLGGRRRRGRMFTPAVPEAGQTASALTAAQLNLHTAWANRLMADFGPAVADPSYKLALLSRTDTRPAPIGSGQTIVQATYLIRSIQVATNVAIISSRKKGRGV